MRCGTPACLNHHACQPAAKVVSTVTPGVGVLVRSELLQQHVDAKWLFHIGHQHDVCQIPWMSGYAITKLVTSQGIMSTKARWWSRIRVSGARKVSTRRRCNRHKSDLCLGDGQLMITHLQLLQYFLSRLVGITRTSRQPPRCRWPGVLQCPEQQHGACIMTGCTSQHRNN